MLAVNDHGPVRELRLANPPVNALNFALVQRLQMELAAAVAQGVRALVLSGPPGMFSAGLDVREVSAASGPDVRRFIDGLFRLQGVLARGRSADGRCRLWSRAAPRLSRLERAWAAG